MTVNRTMLLWLVEKRATSSLLLAEVGRTGARCGGEEAEGGEDGDGGGKQQAAGAGEHLCNQEGEGVQMKLFALGLTLGRFQFSTLQEDCIGE